MFVKCEIDRAMSGGRGEISLEKEKKKRGKDKSRSNQIL